MNRKINQIARSIDDYEFKIESSEDRAYERFWTAMRDIKKIKEGSERSIMFYMKYKARKRGYTDSIDITTNGSEIEEILGMYKKYIDPNIQRYNLNCNCANNIVNLYNKLIKWYLTSS